MGQEFSLMIMAPNKVLYDGKVVSLVAPSELGYMGILAHHAPLVANLKKGSITLRENSGKTAVFVSEGRGLLEVLKNKVTILLNYL